MPVVVAAIVAMDEARVIGKDGALPWHLPEDLQHFRTLTKGCPVVMGRKTWDSLPQQVRPLPGRTNIVVSRSAKPEGVVSDAVLWVQDPLDAVASAKEIAAKSGREGVQRVWIIGGAELYRTLLPQCAEVHLTLVKGVHAGDAHFPPFEHDFALIEQVDGASCSFCTYHRK